LLHNPDAVEILPEGHRAQAQFRNLQTRAS
jgi:hypothetical protein